MNENKFEQMQLDKSTLDAVKEMGFLSPTPIQAKTIPLMMDGYDVIAKAPTGTGKTCAFGIPIIECLDTELLEVQSVIICPTRELCIQITEELRQLVKFRGDIRIAAIYGGQPIVAQISQLKRNPHILVATPGRLLDHMSRGTAWLGSVYTAVLDEADEMLKMGFIDDVRKILNSTPADSQVVMFSATITRDVMNVSWEYQHNAVEITVEASGENKPKIAQYLLMSSGDRRIKDMIKIMREMDVNRVIVFANMKVTVRRLATQLKKLGCSVDSLHGDIPQSQRNKVMQGFRDGKFDVLVATDVAARGIDVEDVEAVFNYDIPDENEYYLHRIGRTGRARRHGMAFMFATPEDKFRIRDIKKYTNSEIEEFRITETGELVTKDGKRLADYQ